MRPVRFLGPIGNSSGYGVAVKNFASAFSLSNTPTKFAFGSSKSKKYSKFLNSLDNYNGKTAIDFYLQGPPWNRHRSLAFYKIAYFYWEADKLPASWKRSLNFVDEIWAPCKLVADACIKAGFRGKLRIVPTPIREWDNKNSINIPSPYMDKHVISDDVIKFYSIFQWHERKGYKELLTSYYKAFSNKDNVILVLKVNPLNVGSRTGDAINFDINMIKSKLNLDYYPPVFLMKNIVSEDKIQKIHNTCDIYVAPHHGEGWGVPIHDAMLAGNQIITTKFGGVTEYLDNDSAHIINHKLGPVKGMEWSRLYQPNQRWAYPSTRHLTELMIDVYNNKEDYRSKGLKAKEIAKQMTIESLSKVIDKHMADIKF